MPARRCSRPFLSASAFQGVVSVLCSLGTVVCFEYVTRLSTKAAAVDPGGKGRRCYVGPSFAEAMRLLDKARVWEPA